MSPKKKHYKEHTVLLLVLSLCIVLVCFFLFFFPLSLFLKKIKVNILLQCFSLQGGMLQCVQNLLLSSANPVLALGKHAVIFNYTCKFLITQSPTLLQCLEKPGYHIPHHQPTPCHCSLTILSQHRHKTLISLQVMLRLQHWEHHSLPNLFNDGALLEHSTSATGSLWSMDTSPWKKPGGLQAQMDYSWYKSPRWDFNLHKWRGNTASCVPSN